VQSVPGVSIRTSGPGMGEFEMRGIASTGGNSPTVGFYYDDVSLTSPSASNEGTATQRARSALSLVQSES